MRNTHKISSKRYNSIHYWLRNNYTKPTICSNENCDRRFTNIGWALLKGKRYAKIKTNFIALCRSCHTKYDMTEETKRKIGRKLRGGKMPLSQRESRYKPIIQLTFQGKFIKKYKSVSEASKTTETDFVAIVNCAKGRTSYTWDIKNKPIKYKWKYA